MKALVSLAVIAAVFYIAICGYLFVSQRSMIFFPQPASAPQASASFVLPVDGAKIQVVMSSRSGPGALIYFGGNAEDVAYSLPELSAAFPDRSIYLPHYRGYGGSTGKPSESALVADALALFDKVRVDHPDIVVVGRSLGSGVAVQLASQRAVARLVLVTPFNSLQELAAEQFPYFPIRWLMRDKFESWRYAGLVVAPTVIVAAERDEVISRSSTDGLYRHFRNGMASMRIVTGAGHNNISGSPEYVSALQETRTADTAGFLSRTVTVDATQYRYLVYVPREFKRTTSWPVILALHGGGQYGRDGISQTDVGLAPAIRQHPERFPAIVVFPQSPPDGTAGFQGLGERIALAALDQSMTEFNGDQARVYLTGISMGGNGAWSLAYRHADRFAALVVVCGFVGEFTGTTSGVHYPALVPTSAGDPHAAIARQVASLPVWIFHGDADQTVPVDVSRRMAAALRAAGASVQYTELPGVGHNAWDAAYGREDLFLWLFRQGRALPDRIPKE